MKKLVLAAIAVLSLGVGSAIAAPVTNHDGQVMWGAAYSSDVAGAG
jgi:hypothetical protein